MKRPGEISKTSNIASIISTVLLWILTFLIFWNKTFTGAGLSPNENVISLNMELVHGEEGHKENSSKALENIIENPVKEELPQKEMPQISQKDPEPVKDAEPVKKSEEKPLQKTEPVKKAEPIPDPVQKKDPSPEKVWELAKSVDDSLGDLWSYDFVDVTESMDDIFDDDYGTKSGSQNAEIYNDGSSNAASGNNGNGLEIRLKDVKERVLISPKEPVITLSRNASTLLTDNIKVHLVCTIKNSGTVSDVSFNPANVLPNSVMKEIRESLLSWIFNQGNSQTVTFELEIEP